MVRISWGWSVLLVRVKKCEVLRKLKGESLWNLGTHLLCLQLGYLIIRLSSQIWNSEIDQCLVLFDSCVRYLPCVGCVYTLICYKQYWVILTLYLACLTRLSSANSCCCYVCFSHDLRLMCYCCCRFVLIASDLLCYCYGCFVLIAATVTIICHY